MSSANSDKFYSQDPSPKSTQLEDFSDKNLIDWVEDEDTLTNDFA